jgi:hypothetical protein
MSKDFHNHGRGTSWIEMGVCLVLSPILWEPETYAVFGVVFRDGFEKKY